MDAERLRLEAAASVPDAERLRLELEFVQGLASPRYVHFLAQAGYLADARFVAYLSYLEYWRRPEYACLLRYPHCLAVLEMLRDAQFRQYVARADVMEFLNWQQYRHWLHHRANRLAAVATGERPAPFAAAIDADPHEERVAPPLDAARAGS